MKVLVYSATPYTRDMLDRASKGTKHRLDYSDVTLTELTAPLAQGYEAICCFVDDDVNTLVLYQLASYGVKLILLRCTGSNNVNLEVAKETGITVMRVASYSPHSVAEFTVAMMLTLNRKLHRSYNRVKEGNFLLDGLLGFDLNGKTVGIIGTGKIGSVLAHILTGFGCKILSYDLMESTYCRTIGVKYVSLSELLQQSNIVSLHLPLTPDTFHLINKDTLALMQDNSILINTSRGAIVNTADLISVLKQRRLSGVGLDVYEEESELYYHDLRDQIIDDDTFARLISFPNVLVTGHQAFFTREALDDIAETTIKNLTDYEAGVYSSNTVTQEQKIEQQIPASRKGEAL